MKLTIWKWPFDVVDDFVLAMPEGASVLTVQMQGDQPCLWALVDADAPREPRPFKVFGTGHPIRHDGHLHYVGTFQVFGGSLIYHLFDATPIKVTSAPLGEAASLQDA